jgi:Zn-dependent M16 (insulinase) family peptidase
LEIDRAIIGSAKHAERPIRPGEATGTALRRHLRGDSPQRREERYARLLRAKPDEVKRVLLEELEQNEAAAAVCVVSSREKLEQANREMPGRELAIEDILKT